MLSSDTEVELVWRAFELRPEPVPTLPPNGEYLLRTWKSSIYPLAERMNVMMHLPPVQPRSRLAHQAAKWAFAQGSFDDYNRGVFRALFERGEDIAQPAVLTSLAARLGMDGSALEESLVRREFEPNVLNDEELASTLGIRGVPAFVANRAVALSGVQPLSELQRLLEQARASRPQLQP